MRLKEIHSSDLTASCPKFVELRLKGMTRPAATTALYRGLVAGESMRLLHERHIHGGTEPALYSMLVSEAAAIVDATLAAEGRLKTPAVEASMSDVVTDVASACEKYWMKLQPRMSKWTLLGCEVPVRWKYAPRYPEFASHIDCLLRDENGGLVVIDWKWKAESPTYQYLARNMQMACYYACCFEGRFLLNDGLSTEWVSLCEEPRMVWLQLPALLPFGRKTRCEDDKGMEVEFSRGDDRPIRMAWKEIEYGHLPSTVDDIRAALMQRARMFKNDIFPQNPDPVGCTICEAESFCKRFDTIV
jgi:hypothetical protein